MNPSQNPSAIRSKNEITNTLLQLMNTYPYQEITVKQLILESHIARKTFYRNFLSKDDVLDSYIDRIMYEYIESLLQIPNCKLSHILDVILGFCTQNQHFLFQLRDNDLMHLLLKKWNTFIPIMHNQVVRSDHPIFQGFIPEQVDYIIAFNVGAVWNVLMKWIEHDMQDAPEYVKKTILDYLDNLSRFI